MQNIRPQLRDSGIMELTSLSPGTPAEKAAEDRFLVRPESE